MNIFCQDRNVAPKTGVAKPYPCHTTFQTGVAAATPATPLPAPLPKRLRLNEMPSPFELILWERTKMNSLDEWREHNNSNIAVEFY